MPLLPVPASPDDWPDEILAEAKGQFNCVISVYLPGTPGEYDFENDEPGDPTDVSILIEDRPARAQHSRRPIDNAQANDWTTQMDYHFQTEILPGDPEIPKGAVVTMTGGRDPILETYTFNVLKALNSSHAALRTIRTIAEAPRG